MVHDLEDNIEYLTHMEDIVVKDLKKRLRTRKDEDDAVRDFEDVAVKHRNAVDSEYEYVSDDEDETYVGSGHRTVYVM